MDQTYMKQKPVLPLVVSMALPMTLSMFVNSLYNIVDSIFIAKISDNAMTALSLVYPIQNLIKCISRTASYDCLSNLYSTFFGAVYN
mgnify:CR=1 FL=1